MKKVYNIVDQNILIDTDFDYKMDDAYNPFLECDSTYDVKYKFNKINKLDNNLFLKNKKLHSKNLIEIYDNENGYLRLYLNLSQQEPYGYLYEEKNDNKEYNVYIDLNKNVDVNTFKIFEMIGLESYFCKKNIFILHSSYIKWNDCAILFSGPSGMGKSTQADLWHKYEGCEIINGDRSAITKKDGVWNAYGLPFAGSSRIYKNVKNPIKCVVVLKQAKNNNIRKLSPLEAFKYIYSQTTVNDWNKEYINTIINLIEEFVKEIPVFMLECKPDNTAVQLLKETLRGEV